MAFRFSKQDDARFVDLIQRLGTAQAEVETAVATYNEIAEEARGKVDDATNAYNEIVAEAQGVVEDIANEMQGEFDDKSERWQEGERGMSVQDWIQELEGAKDELEPVEVPEFEALDLDMPDHGGTLDNLPRECAAD